MLVLVTEKKDGAYVMNLLLPEESRLPEGIQDQAVLLLDAHLSGGSLMENADSGGTQESVEEALGQTAVREILSYVIPYLNIMVLYFFVLFYGQAAAQSVITEKTSKLMEFFLISVRPAVMILGKLTAVCLCGIIQLGSWIVCLLLGTCAGGAAALAIAGEAKSASAADMIEMIGSAADGMFSISGAVLMLLMIGAGMFLYCSLAAAGGALAGKPEDLSSTNVVFTLVLVVSFFTCLGAGGLSGLEGGGRWLDWIPFTAIMVTPARILLGSVSLLRGTASLLLIVGMTLAITMMAGRLYEMMVLYKGNVPGPKKILEMMKRK